MNEDLSELLKAWPHEPGRINARLITGEGDVQRLQVRVELGILQMELEGRPDGHRPDGYPSLLEYHRGRLRWYIEQTGSEVGYVITAEECRALREEAVLYYHRYVAFFALGDYDAVIRDTVRNLDVFDLCRELGESPEDRAVLEQFRPSVIMMRTRAEAELGIAAKQPKQALAAIDHGLDEIRAVYDEAGNAAGFDHANEVHLLRGMRDALVPKLPSSQRAELVERLQAALDAENYELAAILRDELRLLH